MRPGRRGGGGGPVTVINADLLGASVEAMVKLEWFVRAQNATVERRAVGAVVNARRRNPILFQ